MKLENKIHEFNNKQKGAKTSSYESFKGNSSFETSSTPPSSNPCFNKFICKNRIKELKNGYFFRISSDQNINRNNNQKLPKESLASSQQCILSNILNEKKDAFCKGDKTFSLKNSNLRSKIVSFKSNHGNNHISKPSFTLSTRSIDKILCVETTNDNNSSVRRNRSLCTDSKHFVNKKMKKKRDQMDSSVSLSTSSSSLSKVYANSTFFNFEGDDVESKLSEMFVECSETSKIFQKDDFFDPNRISVCSGNCVGLLCRCSDDSSNNRPPTPHHPFHHHVFKKKQTAVLKTTLLKGNEKILKIKNNFSNDPHSDTEIPRILTPPTKHRQSFCKNLATSISILYSNISSKSGSPASNKSSKNEQNLDELLNSSCKKDQKTNLKHSSNDNFSIKSSFRRNSFFGGKSSNTPAKHEQCNLQKRFSTLRCDKTDRGSFIKRHLNSFKRNRRDKDEKMSTKETASDMAQCKWYVVKNYENDALNKM